MSLPRVTRVDTVLPIGPVPASVMLSRCSIPTLMLPDAPGAMFAPSVEMKWTRTPSQAAGSFTPAGSFAGGALGVPSTQSPPV